MPEEVNKVIDLNGAYRHKVDAKGRMSLPTAFRKVLSEDLVVTINPTDDRLYVFTPQAHNEWIIQAFEDGFGGYDSTNDDHVMLRTALKARAVNVSIDSAGRIMLPARLREAVGIVKDVVVVGNTGYFEIWDEQRYDQRIAAVDLGKLFGRS